MITDKLIFDRTIADVNNRTSKGFYNVQDIKRINSYIEYLSANLGLSLEIINPNLGEALTLSKIQVIINNVNSIRKNWYVASDTPVTPIATSWDYEKANNIEKILQALYDFMISAKNDRLYSGTFSSGSHIKFRVCKAENELVLTSSDNYSFTTADGFNLTVQEV